MKIAVFEPHTRLCGVTKWTFDVAAGFRDLGHECDVVSFTKSGKARKSGVQRFNGWYWWHEEPSRMGTWLQAGKILDEYDLIVLNEPKNGTEDREAVRYGIDPWYIGALRRTKTPWMTILHAPQYDSKRAPYLTNCLEAGNFTGFVVEHQGGSYESGAYAFEGRVKKMTRWPWLPYRMVGRPEGVIAAAGVVVAGRSTPVKGHVTLAAYADQFPPGWQAILAGSESGGMGPAYSFLIYEQLTQHQGWTGQRTGRPGKASKPDQWGNSGDKLQAIPWWATKGEHVVQYTGSYDDAVGLYAQYGVAINLTAKSFACGVEYSILEAMDAGSVVIAPAHCMDNAGDIPYQVVRLETLTEPVRINKKTGFGMLPEETGAELVQGIHTAVSWATSGTYDPSHNRRVLESIHAPRHLANHILENAT